MTVNRDPHATHVVESVDLYGSLVDPNRKEVTDVDLIVRPKIHHARGAGIRDHRQRPALANLVGG